jgi:hypothetical protein
MVSIESLIQVRWRRHDWMPAGVVGAAPEPPDAPRSVDIAAGADAGVLGVDEVLDIAPGYLVRPP